MNYSPTTCEGVESSSLSRKSHSICDTSLSMSHLTCHFPPFFPKTFPYTLLSNHFPKTFQDHLSSSLVTVGLSKRQPSVETLEPNLILFIFTIRNAWNLKHKLEIRSVFQNYTIQWFVNGIITSITLMQWFSNQYSENS